MQQVFDMAFHHVMS